MTHQERMDYVKNIQDRNQALIQRLNGMVRETPISDSFSLLGKLLVDQGLADTRAGAIDTAVRSVSNPNYSELRSAILNCDSSNFPWLIKIAPRLILISLQTSVDVALIERTENAFNQLDKRAS
jgi:hypothetical protein